MTKQCDFCQKELNLSIDRWLYQDDGSYIHIDCIEPALAKYIKSMGAAIEEQKFKLLSKMDPGEPWPQGWHETCEWCGHITQSPNETHVCQEQI